MSRRRLHLTQESLRRKVNLVFNHQAPVTAWHTMVHYQLLCGGSDSKGVYVCVCESVCGCVWSTYIYDVNNLSQLWHFNAPSSNKLVSKCHPLTQRNPTASLSWHSDPAPLLTSPFHIIRTKPAVSEHFINLFYIHNYPSIFTAVVFFMCDLSDQSLPALCWFLITLLFPWKHTTTHLHMQTI